MIYKFEYGLSDYIKNKYGFKVIVEKEFNSNGYGKDGEGYRTDHYKFTFKNLDSEIKFYQYGQNQSSAEKQIDKEIQKNCPELLL